MRRALLLAALLTALPVAAQAQVDVQLEEAVRCYNAASIYAQYFALARRVNDFQHLTGYAAELRGRAFAIGARHGTSRDAVRAEFADTDTNYVHRFYTFARRNMEVSDFGAGEIDHCGLARIAR